MCFKTATIALTLFVLTSSSFAADKCTEGLTFNGFTGKLTCGGTKLSPKELPDIMAQVPEANEIYLKGKSMTKGAVVPAMIGGFGLGWGIGMSILEQPLSVTAGPALIIGVVGVAIGLPIAIAGSNKTKKAVDIYNDKVKTTSLMPSFELAGNSLNAVWEF